MRWFMSPSPGSAVLWWRQRSVARMWWRWKIVELIICPCPSDWFLCSGDQARQQGVPWPSFEGAPTECKCRGGHCWESHQMCGETGHSVWLWLQVSRFIHHFSLTRGLQQNPSLIFNVWSATFPNTFISRSNCETFCNLILFDQPVAVQATNAIGPVRSKLHFRFKLNASASIIVNLAILGFFNCINCLKCLCCCQSSEDMSLAAQIQRRLAEVDWGTLANISAYCKFCVKRFWHVSCILQPIGGRSPSWLGQ